MENDTPATPVSLEDLRTDDVQRDVEGRQLELIVT